MAELSKERLERYLTALFHAPVSVTALVSLVNRRRRGRPRSTGTATR